MFATPLLHTFLQLLLVVSPAAPAHPHYPKALVIGGAGGKITVLYFTVPFNAEHLEGKRAGFSWHLGFSALKTEVPLTIAGTAVPAGDYKMDARLGEDGTWGFVLSNLELAMARMRARFARGERGERAKERLAALEKELAESGGDREYVLGPRDFETAHSEHLSMTALLGGFTTARRGSEEPRDGVEFALRVSFGDLHRELEVEEVFAAGDAPQPGRRGPGRDG